MYLNINFYVFMIAFFSGLVISIINIPEPKVIYIYPSLDDIKKNYIIKELKCPKI